MHIARLLRAVAAAAALATLPLLHLALLAAAAAAALQQKFFLDEVKREGGEAFTEAKAVVVAHNELLFG